MRSSKIPHRAQVSHGTIYSESRSFSASYLLLGLWCLITSSAFAGEPRTVWLANEVESERRGVVCFFDVPFAFPEPGEVDNEPMTPGDLAIVQTNTAQYLADAGITNVEITTVEPENPDITVHFQGYRGCLAGEAVDGVDQFDEVKTDERVVMFANTPDFWIPTDVARDLAHEIGHTFGLGHIVPMTVQDPDKESIMDNRFPGACGGGCAGDRFLNGQIDLNVFFYEDEETHNPTYHLRRYVGGEENLDLQNAGICPGEYDLNPPGFFEQQVRLIVDVFSDPAPDRSENGDGPVSEIFDLVAVVDEGGDALQVIQRVDVVSSSETQIITFPAQTGQPFQLFASSVEGGEPDIFLAGEAEPSGTLELFPIETGNSGLRLLRRVGEDQYEQIGDTIVSALGGALLKDSFENLLPGRTPKQTTNNDPNGGAILPQCVRTRLIGAFLDGPSERLFPYLIDAATGDVDSLTTTVIDTPGWIPSSFRVDAQRGFYYARSGNNVLFQFDLESGEEVNSSTISGSIQAYDVRLDGFLTGIGFNSQAGQNYIAQINPETGALTVLDSITFGAGFFGDTVTIDRAIGSLWVVTPDSTLYEFDAFSGEFLRTVGISNAPTSMAVKPDGDLIGVGYNTGAMEFFVVSIDYVTGESNVLNTFNMPPSQVMGRISVDPLTERLYVASTDGVIFVFDIYTGELLDEIITGPAFQAVRVIENPMSR